MDKISLPEEIYQKAIKNEISKEDAAKLLKNFVYRTPDVLEVKENVYKITKELSIDSENAKKYVTEGVLEKEAKALGLLEALLGISFKKLPPDEFLSEKNAQYYSINEDGHIIKLAIGGYEGPKLLFFPKEICSLIHLDALYLEMNGLKEIPECIGNLQFLKKLDLSYNEIQSLPTTLKNLSHLEYLNLQRKDFVFYLNNLLDYIDFTELKNNINKTGIGTLMEKKLHILENAKEYPWKFEKKTTTFPPEKILETRDFEYLILWMLNKNNACTWSDFKSKFNTSDQLLVDYIGTLNSKQFIEEKEYINKMYYRITPFGVRRLKKIENTRNLKL